MSACTRRSSAGSSGTSSARCAMPSGRSPSRPRSRRHSSASSASRCRPASRARRPCSASPIACSRCLTQRETPVFAFCSRTAARSPPPSTLRSSLTSPTTRCSALPIRSLVANAAGEDTTVGANVLGEKLWVAKIKDLDGDGRPCTLGEGVVPCQSFVKSLCESDFTGCEWARLRMGSRVDRRPCRSRERSSGRLCATRRVDHPAPTRRRLLMCQRASTARPSSLAATI